MPTRLASCFPKYCPNPNNLPFGFTSALRSPVTGLIHMRARWYSPQLGQFISPDPLGYIDSYNLYSYALFDPINNWDPYGLSGGGFADILMGFGTALGNSGVAMGKMAYNLVRHPIDSRVGIANGIANTWNDAYQLDGVLGGVNAFNPLYHAIIGYYEFEQSLARSQHHQAGQHLFDYVGGVIGTASIASSAAAAGSARVGAGAKAGKGGICSFTEDTPVLMCDGSLKPIQHVRAHEFVLSRSEETGEFGCREVVEPYSNPDKAIIRIELLAPDGSLEVIEATANHPFYVEGQGWTRVDELGINDLVPGSTGELLRIVALESTDRVEIVFNFGVEEFHSYFVGELGAWVHNCNPNIKGGPHREVRAANIGGEVHHMPANSVSPLPRGQGPSIHMDTADHLNTASWGNFKSAQRYRKKQKNLIEQGRFDDAIQMDIDDIQLRFGSKYDDAILQMIDSLP